MSGATKNTISSQLEQWLREKNNFIEIIAKLSEVASSTRDSIEVQITNTENVVQTLQLPSMGFLKSQIDRLDANIQNLSGLDDSNSTVRLPDGSYKKIYESTVLRDPQPIGNLIVPQNFKIKNNWFFESFLSPLLFVSFDVTNFVVDDMKQAVVKRLIVNAEATEQKTYFDNTYKGKNDISYQSLTQDLGQKGIGYFFDEEVVDLPVSIMRFIGNFDVLKTIDEQVEETVNNETVTVKRRKYKLNKLTYTDSLSGFENSKTLKPGDVLMTKDGSKYNISSIDTSNNTLVLKRASGYQEITIGTDILNIQSPPFSSKEIQVNVGFNERQVIFLKPIEPKFQVTSSSYSPGVGFWSNELQIATADGLVTLDTFYKNNVTDFGAQFINSAKDQTVPAVLAELPDAPVLDAAHFKIVQINTHKKDTTSVAEIKTKLSTKTTIKNEMAQIDQTINQKKDDLNNSTIQRSPAERKKIRADLDRLSKDKISKSNLYSSVVKELSSRVVENPVVVEKPIFRLRGFWAIPAAKLSENTRPQEIIQFEVQYRYLKKDGNSVGPEQIEFTDTDGTKRKGVFSNWVPFKTDIRKRVFNQSTGFFEWTIEDVESADTPNMNQLDIGISRGEKVEIRVRSISEAGWPSNPIMSEFSPAIIVDFPDDLSVADETEFVLQEATKEESRVNFQDELNAKGLDIHLLTSFTSGDKFFAHEADTIASGFFTPEGNVIDLFQKIKDLEQQLINITQLLSAAKGELVVYLLDETGGVLKISHNSTTKVFGGFYKELVTDSTGAVIHGDIITKHYTLRIQNTSATPLELASAFPGGFEQVLDPSISSVDDDYKNNRKYDIVPMVLSGVSLSDVKTNDSKIQISPFQSAQIKSQFIYSRYKSVGLEQELYQDNTGGVFATDTQNIDVEINQYLVPVLSSSLNGGANANVWNGTYSGITPVGNGQLNEFCIHKSHPDLRGQAIQDLITPRAGSTFSTTASSYPVIMHSRLFNRGADESNGKKQLAYFKPTSVAPPATLDSNLLNSNYPCKLGFLDNDKYLIGKYTCGAYLFLSPAEYPNVMVEGSTALATKLVETGEQNALNIPIIFQFRCSDKLSFIGGWRSGTSLKNITYTKKVGIDIQVKGKAPFSFDLELSCKYTRDSLIKPNFIPHTVTDIA
jgi:hypothetical protein